MKWFERLIIFLIRIRLGVGKWDEFYFTNQRMKDDRYYFTPVCLMKYCSATNTIRKAHVSLNYLLSNDCEIVIDEDFDWTDKVLDKLNKGG